MYLIIFFVLNFINMIGGPPCSTPSDRPTFAVTTSNTRTNATSAVTTSNTTTDANSVDVNAIKLISIGSFIFLKKKVLYMDNCYIDEVYLLSFLRMCPVNFMRIEKTDPLFQQISKDYYGSEISCSICRSYSIIYFEKLTDQHEQDIRKILDDLNDTYKKLMVLILNTEDLYDKTIMDDSQFNAFPTHKESLKKLNLYEFWLKRENIKYKILQDYENGGISLINSSQPFFIFNLLDFSNIDSFITTYQEKAKSLKKEIEAYQNNFQQLKKQYEDLKKTMQNEVADHQKNNPAIYTRLKTLKRVLETLKNEIGAKKVDDDNNYQEYSKHRDFRILYGDIITSSFEIMPNENDVQEFEENVKNLIKDYDNKSIDHSKNPIYATLLDLKKKLEKIKSALDTKYKSLHKDYMKDILSHLSSCERINNKPEEIAKLTLRMQSLIDKLNSEIKKIEDNNKTTSRELSASSNLSNINNAANVLTSSPQNQGTSLMTNKVQDNKTTSREPSASSNLSNTNNAANVSTSSSQNQGTSSPFTLATSEQENFDAIQCEFFSGYKNLFQAYFAYFIAVLHYIFSEEKSFADFLNNKGYFGVAYLKNKKENSSFDDYIQKNQAIVTHYLKNKN